jgi:transcriptional regulator with XRE-family HTH domain
MAKELEPGLARLYAGISRALKQFRKDAGLSQVELASMVDCNQSLISRLERMECDNYSLSTLYRIFDKMNLDLQIHVVEREMIPTDQPLR